MLVWLLFLTGCASSSPRKAKIKERLSPSLIDELSQSDEFVIYSLYPFWDVYDCDEWKNGEWQRGWFEQPIIAKAKVESVADRRRFLSALRTALKQPTVQMLCFLPRHAFSAKVGERWIYVSICFECGNVQSSSSLRGWNLDGAVGRTEPEAFRELYAKYELPVWRETYNEWMARKEREEAEASGAQQD